MFVEHCARIIWKVNRKGLGGIGWPLERIRKFPKGRDTYLGNIVNPRESSFLC